MAALSFVSDGIVALSQERLSNALPEPGTTLIFGLGFACVDFLKRRTRPEGGPKELAS